MTAVLDVQGLRTEYLVSGRGVPAVNGVSLTIGEGECVGLVGESGSGKSTVGLSVMRLLPAGARVTAGQVTFAGRDISTASEHDMERIRGNEVAMVFQDPLSSLNPTMTVGRQIAEAIEIHASLDKGEVRRRTVEALELVRMPRPAERLGDYPHQLSGGLRQRVMIAMALVNRPALLIADEPTTALDVTIQAQILDLLDELRHRLGMALLLITHDMGVIAGRTDRVSVMYGGRIVETATTGELFSDGSHPYSRALLASVPTIDQDPRRRLQAIEGLPPDLSSPPPGCPFEPRCAFARPECSVRDPELEAVPDGDTHQVACFRVRDVRATFDGTRTGSLGTGSLGTGSLGTGSPSTGSLGTGSLGTGSPGTGSPSAALGTDAGTPENGAPDVDIATGQPVVAADVPTPARHAARQAGPLLVVDDVVKEFGGRRTLLGRRPVLRAVSGVSFTVDRGETLGLVGESGCGKTTLARMIVGLEPATSGSVTFDGQELSSLRRGRLRRHRRDLQFMFQDPYASLDPRMKVGASLREPLVIQGIGDRRRQWERVGDLLGDVGLSASASSRFPHEFSGGQRQRLGLARALAVRPKLVVADEPVSALDVSVQAQVLNLMKDLQQAYDLSYVVISHDLAVVKYLSDRIGVMYLGKLVEIGPAASIYARTAHHYTDGLIGSIPAPFDQQNGGSRTLGGELPSPVDPPSGCRFRTRCPAVQDRCAVEEPPLTELDPGHWAACHFPLVTASRPHVLA